MALATRPMKPRAAFALLIVRVVLLGAGLTACSSGPGPTARSGHHLNHSSAVTTGGSLPSSPATPPPNAIPTTPALNSVSCVSGGKCLAVGTRLGAAAALSRSAPGSPWSAVGAGPSPVGSVSCVGPTTCLAVGGDQTSTFQEWNGGSWAVLPSPPTAQSQGAGVDVVSAPSVLSCVSTTFCAGVAEGLALAGGLHQSGVVETWNGQAWATPEAPPITTPYAGDTSLPDVSCVSSSFCMAVGSQPGRPHQNAALVYEWDGTRWKTVASPFESGSTTLQSVSCTSTDFCIALGTVETETQDRLITEGWNGVTWANESAPVPIGREVGLPSQLGLDCTSQTWCIMVWSSTCPAIRYGGPTPCGVKGYPAVSQLWSGSMWKRVPMANPNLASGQSYLIAQASCISRDACVAVGVVGGQPPGLQPGLIESWNGSRWMVEREPSS